MDVLLEKIPFGVLLLSAVGWGVLIGAWISPLFSGGESPGWEGVRRFLTRKPGAMVSEDDSTVLAAPIAGRHV